MKIERFDEGDTGSLPVYITGGKGGGWVPDIEAPTPGILVLLNTEEQAAGAVFITYEDLKKAGFVCE